MQKTKLGISVGLLAAAIYFMGLFSGYLVAVLLTGYVLLFEENGWLKKNAVRAVALMAAFSLLTVGINLIPNVLGAVDNLLGIFGVNFSYNIVGNIVSLIVRIIDIVEKVLFILLGVKALNQGTIAIPVVDGLVSKYMD